MVELGHPEQLPFNSTVTTPLLKDLNVMSPPSFATAGLTFESKTSLILFTISFSSFFFESVEDSLNFFFYDGAVAFGIIMVYFRNNVVL